MLFGHQNGSHTFRCLMIAGPLNYFCLLWQYSCLRQEPRAVFGPPPQIDWVPAAWPGYMAGEKCSGKLLYWETLESPPLPPCWRKCAPSRTIPIHLGTKAPPGIPSAASHFCLLHQLCIRFLKSTTAVSHLQLTSILMTLDLLSPCMEHVQLQGGR